MAARPRKVLEESEKDDWSKQAAVEIERALGQVAPETRYDEIDPKRTERPRARRRGALLRLPGAERPMQICTSCERGSRPCGMTYARSAATGHHRSKH
jgi:hypothetical protein